MIFGSVCSGIGAPELAMIGRTNGRLTVLRLAPGISKDGHRLWVCRCDCGNEKTVQTNNLRHSGVRSCGCLRTEAAQRRIQRDGAWNEGKSYAINGGERCYRNRAAWARAAIRHYGNQCRVCGWDKARCDVHHREPKARGGLHTIANAKVLCPNCHRIEHEAAS